MAITVYKLVQQLPSPLRALIRDQRGSFLIIGGVNTLASYLIFALLLGTVGQFLEPKLGRALGADVVLVGSYILGVLLAFVLYRRFVFRVRGHVLRDLLRFASVYVISISVNLLVLPLLVGVANLAPLLAQALIVCVIALISYFGHREFSFRRPGA